MRRISPRPSRTPSPKASRLSLTASGSTAPASHVDDILTALERALRHDGRDVRRLPHRLHWVLWLLAEVDPT